MKISRFWLGLESRHRSGSRLFTSDDSGQMILMTCVSIVLALILITIYGYSSLGTGEGSINRENMNAYYYYDNIRDRYTEVYKSPDADIFKKDIKDFALLHGYSVDFVCNKGNSKIIFVDKDIRIEEELEGGSCS